MAKKPLITQHETSQMTNRRHFPCSSSANMQSYKMLFEHNSGITLKDENQLIRWNNKPVTISWSAHCVEMFFFCVCGNQQRVSEVATFKMSKPMYTFFVRFFFVCLFFTEDHLKLFHYLCVICENKYALSVSVLRGSLVWVI